MKGDLRVLVVDDERLTRETAVRQLKETGFEAESADSGYDALERLTTRPFDVVISDLRMPGLDGMELLRNVKKARPDVDVIVMTAYGSVETAVAAIKEGASDYLIKPFAFRELEHRLRKLDELRGFRREVDGLRALLHEGDDQIAGIVGRSPIIRRVGQLLETYAQHDAPVLVVGETGTGKEMVSRALHQLSPRARKPFVAVACGAIPSELAESELFGHEKGAFTGAIGQRFGAFERANGGTLLLDDVDDLPLNLQVKLLRVLEGKSFTRVGGSKEIAVDARVVATSKVNLAELAASGRFRQDLYYRLRALEVRLPPLRDRGEDILVLAEHFLKRFAETAPGKKVSIGPDAAACLRHHHWPGNVRELRHAIESAAIVCTSSTIGPECLPESVRTGSQESSHELFTLHIEGQEQLPFQDMVRTFEDTLIRWAMRRAGNQQSGAAELLGLPRTTLQSKLGRFTTGPEKPNGNGRGPTIGAEKPSLSAEYSARDDAPEGITPPPSSDVEAVRSRSGMRLTQPLPARRARTSRAS